ncbi:hypothetical protein EYF80_054303 [Liparis tanakae]|uniref:Uncharacterized protein n=1 Tax=Liparis tanakae TaxID=230148 RepID=A0A4Z2F3Q7_9TELE|nr:hypothetical protein EYF80_054303 [Liparis tanakae]
MHKQSQALRKKEKERRGSGRFQLCFLDGSTGVAAKKERKSKETKHNEIDPPPWSPDLVVDPPMESRPGGGSWSPDLVVADG